MKRMKLYTSVFLLALVVSACFITPLISTVDANEQNISNRYLEPCSEHLLGTDSLGRDIFLRICAGGRTSLIVSFTCAIITTVLGSVYGGVSAFYPCADRIMMPILEMISSVPDILLVIVLALWFGNKSVLVVIFAISITGWYKIARLTRNLIMPLRTANFVIEAESFHKSTLSIICGHMIPNISSSVISRAVLSIPEFIFYESFLSYLGIGISPPDSSWGVLISQAQSNYVFYPQQLVGTSIFLIVTLISINWLGDCINTAPQKSVSVHRNNDDTAGENANISTYDEDVVLFVENLSAWYGDRPEKCVEKVSFCIHTGEIIGLVGQSGCGKTSIARAISGLMPLYNGTLSSNARIIFQNCSIDYASKKSVKRICGINGIALIHQDPLSCLDPTMKIGEQLFECLPFRNRNNNKVDSTVITKALADVGLREGVERLLNMYSHQLSGGIAQRVMIAMAIIRKPSLLICDEPTASLDYINRKAIIELIKRLSKEHNTAVLFISHDVNAVLAVASQVMVMDKGRIVDKADSERLVESKVLFTQSLFNTELKREQPPVDLHTSPTSLRVEHLSYKYRLSDAFAIHNISFKLKQGEVFGILGESGSGKTTIAKLLMGQIAIQHGTVWTSPEITAIQYLFQNPQSSFDPMWVIGKSLVEGIQERRITADIAEMLSSVGLDSSITQRYPNEVSLGQCQRAAIARALSVNPKLLICDEPTSALDSVNQKIILDLLRRLDGKREYTYIFISHDLDVIEYMSDRVAVMYKGEFVEVAATNDLFQNALHPYTKTLLAGNPLDTSFVMDYSKGCGFYPYCKERSEECLQDKPELERCGADTVEERHHFVACFKRERRTEYASN